MFEFKYWTVIVVLYIY